MVTLLPASIKRELSFQPLNSAQNRTETTTTEELVAPATITCCGVGVVQSGLMLTLTLTGSGEAPGVGMSVLMLTAARGAKSDHGR